MGIRLIAEAGSACCLKKAFERDTLRDAGIIVSGQIRSDVGRDLAIRKKMHLPAANPVVPSRKPVAAR